VRFSIAFSNAFVRQSPSSFDEDARRRFNFMLRLRVRTT
jgi:hypothetical protein